MELSPAASHFTYPFPIETLWDEYNEPLHPPHPGGGPAANFRLEEEEEESFGFGGTTKKAADNVRVVIAQTVPSSLRFLFYSVIEFSQNLHRLLTL